MKMRGDSGGALNRSYVAPTLGGMGKQTFIAPPVAKPSLDGGECPECEHESIGKRGWFERVFRLKPSCHVWLTSAETGDGFPGKCHCTHPAHL